MKRRRLMQAAMMGFLTMTWMSSAARPNIVLFFVDDLGRMDAGVQGSVFYETPNFDKLSEEGLRDGTR